MTQTATAHFGHHTAAGRDDGGDDEGGLVADAAGGMLVHATVTEGGEIHRIAGMRHRIGEIKDLAVGHPLEVDGHGHCRHLIVGDIAGGIGGDHLADLVRGQRLAVFFLFNEIVHSHSRIPQSRLCLSKTSGNSAPRVSSLICLPSYSNTGIAVWPNSANT